MPANQKIRVSTGFDSGRVEVAHVGAHGATLRVPHDVAAPRFRQWFAFDVEREGGGELEINLENAGECTWADAMGGDYRVYFSEGEAWHRAASSLVGGRLVLRQQLTNDRARFAYYPPYPARRLADVRRWLRKAGGEREELAKSSRGHVLERFSVGAPGRKNVWVIAQQHPGEQMAGWFVEGLMEALTDGTRPGRRLLEVARVHVIPRMNLDGAALGNHRTDAAGVDQNRAWDSATPPIEVAAARAAMKAFGGDLFVDVHGEERLPWVFAQAADHYAGRPAEVDEALRRFEEAMKSATPDFQTTHKYPYDASGKPSLAFGSNWAQAELGCPALTLEMPFSDHRDRPNPRGFFPGRARKLGRRAVLGMLAALGETR